MMLVKLWSRRIFSERSGLPETQTETPTSGQETLILWSWEDISVFAAPAQIQYDLNRSDI